jgi:long-chain acyl-CoA synthetase
MVVILLKQKNRTKDGFARTGDFGHYGEDGVLYFNGRIKDLIKHNGYHLYPKEMELIIQKHPAVAEVVVFGIPDLKAMVI